MATGIMVIIIVIAMILFWIIGTYNRLVRLRNQVKNSWAQIDVQLQRRYDLIPNLVECVKEYMQYERSTLQAVIQARSAAVSAREEVAQKGGPTQAPLKDLLSAETALKGAMANIFALAENYPQLRASENMRSLQEELASTENRVAFARQAYNDCAMTYNNGQQQFPAVVIAKSFGHHLVDLYTVEETEAKKGVKVQF